MRFFSTLGSVVSGFYCNLVIMGFSILFSGILLQGSSVLIDVRLFVEKNDGWRDVRY